MKTVSAGILLYRYVDCAAEVFLVHPGGPYFAKKDDGVWSIPKGELSGSEDPLETAKREFAEETGKAITGNTLFEYLGLFTQSEHKDIHVWALEFDCGTDIKSNEFEMEWPKGSGTMQKFVEVDKAGWFSVDVARKKVFPGQAQIFNRLEEMV